MNPTPVALARKREAQARGGRTFAEALESPCLTCEGSPCCTHLPLRSFEVTSLADLDYARYLLNFEGIELGIADTGAWDVFYVRPCRFLDDEARCSLHGTAAQPSTCKTYNAHSCGYRHTLAPDATDYVRLDRARFEFLMEGILFDEDRNIASVPGWEVIVENLQAMPLVEPDLGPAPASPALDAWAKEVLTGAEPAPATLRMGLDADFLNPCEGCAAYCCQHLVFPLSVSRTASSLDYVRFALGFPGVEVGVADDSWCLTVRTTCRHLDGGQCSVFGQPDRPLVCSSYDALGCTYRSAYGLTRPPKFLRITLEHFPFLLECCGFDEDNNLVAVPSVTQLRAHVEQRWRELVGVPEPAQA